MARRSCIGAVLAGGGGRRIGGDKAMVELEGRPLVHYPLNVLRAVLDEVAIVAKQSTVLPGLDVEIAIWLEPEEPRHPLAGVVHALRCARGRPVVVVAGDMPFVTRGLVAALAGERSRGAAAVVPRAGGRLQPLCARYETRSPPWTHGSSSGPTRSRSSPSTAPRTSCRRPRCSAGADARGGAQPPMAL